MSRWGGVGAPPQIWGYKSPSAVGLRVQPAIVTGVTVTGITVTMSFVPAPGYRPAYNPVGIVPGGPVTPPGTWWGPR